METEKKIRLAFAEDVRAVSRIYDHIHDAEEANRASIGWVRGVYPTVHTAEEAITRRDLFVYEEEGQIMASGIVNQIQPPAYAEGNWAAAAAPEEVMVLHTLVVDPGWSGKGIAHAFVQFYEEYARSQGCCELRMDTSEINTPARAMYRKHRFTEIGIAKSELSGIPDVSLVMLEKYIG